MKTAAHPDKGNHSLRKYPARDDAFDKILEREQNGKWMKTTAHPDKGNHFLRKYQARDDASDKNLMWEK